MGGSAINAYRLCSVASTHVNHKINRHNIFFFAVQGLPKANPCVNDSTMSSFLVKIHFVVQLLWCHNKCKTFS